MLGRTMSNEQFAQHVQDITGVEPLLDSDGETRMRWLKTSMLSISTMTCTALSISVLAVLSLRRIKLLKHPRIKRVYNLHQLVPSIGQ